MVSKFLNNEDLKKVEEFYINKFKPNIQHEEVVLYESETIDPFNTNSTITLSQDIDIFDEVIFYSIYNEKGDGNYYCHYGRCVIDKRQIEWSMNEAGEIGQYRGIIDVLASYSTKDYFMCWKIIVDDKRTIRCHSKDTGSWYYDQSRIKQIIGIRYNAIN